MSETDDLRTLVEVDLPQLALGIARDALALCDWQPAQFHAGNCDYSRGMHYMGPDGNSYGYCPFNPDGSPREAAQIWFREPRLIEITDVVPGEVQDLEPNAPLEDLIVDAHVNDGPSPITHATKTEEEGETEDQKSWSETTSKEFQARIKMAAEAGISIELLDVKTSSEFEQTLTRRLEKTEAGAWRRSDRVLDAVEKTYQVFPFMSWELTTQRAIRHIRQDTTARGRLDCKVRIDVQNWSAADWDSLEDLFEMFRGLKTGYARFGQWWSSRTSLHGGPPALADSVIDAWHRPHLALTSTAEGKRTRYTQATSRQTPIKGKQALALDYLTKNGFSIEAIQQVYGPQDWATQPA